MDFGFCAIVYGRRASVEPPHIPVASKRSGVDPQNHSSACFRCNVRVVDAHRCAPHAAGGHGVVSGAIFGVFPGRNSQYSGVQAEGWSGDHPQPNLNGLGT